LLFKLNFLGRLLFFQLLLLLPLFHLSFAAFILVESVFVELPRVLICVRLLPLRAKRLLLHELKVLHHLVMLGVVPLELVVDVHRHVDRLVDVVLLRLVWRCGA